MINETPLANYFYCIVRNLKECHVIAIFDTKYKNNQEFSYKCFL